MDFSGYILGKFTTVPLIERLEFSASQFKSISLVIDSSVNKSPTSSPSSGKYQQEVKLAQLYAVMYSR